VRLNLHRSRGFAALKSICVYCGSATGNDPAFLEEAVSAGTVIAEQHINDIRLTIRSRE